MADLSDLTAQCIRCGFCLESCPTFVISGDESESPRGRIYLVRSLEEGQIQWSQETVAPLQTCVGCRACETACPSGVKYGEILELARSKPAFQHKKAIATLLRVITDPRLLRLQVGLSQLTGVRRMPALMAQRLSCEPQVADIPTPYEGQQVEKIATDGRRGTVSLMRGCAMSVFYQTVNEATENLLKRVGFEVKDVSGCCGALHAHNGHLALALEMAKKFAVKETLVTNSAGCGSWLKDYGYSNVVDISEVLFDSGLAEILADSEGFPGLKVTYHDACHLAHGQNVRVPPRELIKAVPGTTLVELRESDMCCGSGGIYNVLQPSRAKKMLERKWSTILESEADVVVSGNPGCLAWIEQAARESNRDIRVLHTATYLEASFSGNLP